MTALLPRYINIRRGGFVCAAIGLAMCPWNLLSDSNKFTTYLSSYSVFLSSIAGVMLCDYYWVRKGYLRVKDLYNARRKGPYFYIYGVNPRAYGAYIAGILINVVGFAGDIGKTVPIGAQYIYRSVFIYFLSPSLSLLCIIEIQKLIFYFPFTFQGKLFRWNNSLLRNILGTKQAIPRTPNECYLARSWRGYHRYLTCL